MPSNSSLINKLRTDFPQFHFVPGEEFYWTPKKQTIHYKADSTDSAPLLHELAHAFLGHEEYTRDIQLMTYEQAAWDYAFNILAPRYSVAIATEQIDEALDTYRDWLHARSTCPECSATGFQVKQRLYSCLVCRTQWHVNDARVCGLRRSVVHKNTPLL